jgi:threonine/homoserine/homoserine lactone efflux protein
MSLPALFAMAFITALSGAMAPGPFLTGAIAQSAKRGGHVGPLFVLGHAILELALLFLVLLGLDKLFSHHTLTAAISFAGGIVLVWMGIGTLRGLKKHDFSRETHPRGNTDLHPILSGIVLSLSNPYWYIWWVTVATGYLVLAKAYGIRGIVVFFAGHISADFAWYSVVSYGVSAGAKFFSVKVLKGILVVCNLCLVLFGFYFLANGFHVLR